MTAAIELTKAAEALLHRIAAAGDDGIPADTVPGGQRSAFHALWTSKLADHAVRNTKICCIVTRKGRAVLAALEGKAND